jgi:hypothetical protein
MVKADGLLRNTAGESGDGSTPVAAAEVITMHSGSYSARAYLVSWAEAEADSRAEFGLDADATLRIERFPLKRISGGR